VTAKFVSRLAESAPVKSHVHDREPGADSAAPSAGPPLDIESVVIPMTGKTGRRTHTLCVSSQVGCAMGCGFCETAQMGLVRSLSAREIVAQWHAARHVLRGARGVDIANIVFMGMGEPLDNFENVAQAIRVLTDSNGAALPPSKITVSTVGRIDGLRKLAGLIAEPGFGRLGLAVSINAPRDAVRDAIMPINRAMPMGELSRALQEFPHFGKRKICFEYVLIPGVNDGLQDARDLAAYLEPFGAIAPGGERRTPLALVNLIPYNPRRQSPWPAPDEADVDRFMAWLKAEGVYAKRRRTKGRTMMGACGQLGTAEIRKRKYVPLTTSEPRA
jgi:23S rRNA (adenine2503-C2)-methyltransferase